MATTTKGLVTEDMSFFEDYAGAGLDTITSNEQAMSYLSMVQPGSQAVVDGSPEGTWRNSATNENYGNIVRVVPIAFRTIWNERSTEPPFNTVGRYKPHSIDVTIVPPKPGKQGFPKMINPATQNEIQELYIYAVILPDYPEAGVLYFNPTVGSMKACKAWNTQLKGQILPNGAQAPIFAYSWNLICELVQNPQKPSEKIARFSRVQKDCLVSKDLFNKSVKPQLDLVNKSVLLITEDSEIEE